MVKQNKQHTFVTFIVILVMLMVMGLHQQRLVLREFENNESEQTKHAVPAAATPVVSKLKNTDPRDVPNAIHLVFSTGCTQRNSDILALNLQKSAINVGHQASITRLIAGCTDQQKLEHLERISLHPNYNLHFTPDFSKQKQENKTDSYTPYNKPFSVRHWLQNTKTPIREKIIALVDADFIFLKPLVVNSEDPVRYVGSRVNVTNRVERGVGVAQNWRNYMGPGYWGGQRKKLAKLCEDKKCWDVTADEATEHYSATGPPYIMHIDDMRAFADDYCQFTREARVIDKGWMVEMYGFAVAAANNGIKFTLLTDIGITSPKMAKHDREYWTFVDKLDQNPCAKHYEVSEASPVGLHLCQKYEQDESIFYKYAIPKKLLACDSMLFQPPDMSLWSSQTDVKAMGRAWTECTAFRAINSMLVEYKKKACPNGYNSHAAFVLSATSGTKNALPSA